MSFTAPSSPLPKGKTRVIIQRLDMPKKTLTRNFSRNVLQKIHTDCLILIIFPNLWYTSTVSCILSSLYLCVYEPIPYYDRDIKV